MATMHRNCQAFLAIAVVLFVLHSGAQPAPPRPANFRADRILVKPKPNLDLKDLATLHFKCRTQVLHTFPGIGNLQTLQLPPGANVRDMLAVYEASGLIEYAEADYSLQSFLSPNDPFFLDGTLWNLHNTGISGGVAGADIHASQAWDIQHTASNVIVAVIDSGIRHTHEDLLANLWINPGEAGLDSAGHDKGTNQIDDDLDGYVDDVYG